MKGLRLIIIFLVLAISLPVDIFWLSPAKSITTYPSVNYSAELESFDRSSTDMAPRLSLNHQAKIDSGAVFTKNLDLIKTCQTLPVEIWLLMLLAYLTILIFNLAFDFSCAEKVHWAWEVFYTFLFLAGWFFWDGCRAFVWFPLCIIQSGLVIFGVYLYLFDKKTS